MIVTNDLERLSNKKYSPIKLSKDQLKLMNIYDIYIRKWNKNCISMEFYLKLDNDQDVILCDNCNRFFNEDEWEFNLIEKSSCKFCRISHQVL